MKYIVLTFLLLVCCGQYESKPTKQPMDELKKLRDFYCQNIDQKKMIGEHKGDDLTFTALLDAFCDNIRIDFKKYKYGKCLYNRHIEEVYPEKSRSPISGDPYLSLMHSFISRNDRESLEDVEEIIDYGEDKLWFMCDYGPAEYVNVASYAPIIYRTRSHLQGLFVRDDLIGEEDAIPVPTNFRGYLLGMYIYAHARIKESVNSIEREILTSLRDSEPTSPIYHALAARFLEGNQGKAIDIANKEEYFPRDKVPYTFSRSTNWGGSTPDALVLIITVGILEGR